PLRLRYEPHLYLAHRPGGRAPPEAAGAAADRTGADRDAAQVRRRSRAHVRPAAAAGHREHPAGQAEHPARGGGGAGRRHPARGDVERLPDARVGERLRRAPGAGRAPLPGRARGQPNADRAGARLSRPRQLRRGRPGPGREGARDVPPRRAPPTTVRRTSVVRCAPAPPSMTSPPSTGMTCPVTIFASSEASHTAVPVRSSGSSARWIAIWKLTIMSRKCAGTPCRVASVIVGPGAIAFTRMLYRPTEPAM